VTVSVVCYGGAMDTAYCPACRRRQPILGTTTESQNEGGAAMAYVRRARVTELECGHVLQDSLGLSNGAPGEPYAGGALAGRVVSVDPWDLAANA
jgi:hypothetical protein